MSDYLIKEETLNNLANSVRTLSSSTNELTPDEMITTVNETKSVIDSLNEHINDTNNPHGITTEQLGAVKKTGDTMTGNLVTSGNFTVSRNGYPTMMLKDNTNGSDTVLQHSNHITYISGRDEMTDANRRMLLLRDGVNQAAVKEALQLVDVVDSTQKYYTILHTGNMSELGAAKIAVGSYTGTDMYGSSNPNSLTFSFAPKLILIFAYDGYDWFGFDSGYGDSSVTPYKHYILCSELSTSYTNTKFPGYEHDRSKANLSQAYAKKSSDGKTISWYNAGTHSYTQVAQLNCSTYQYRYIAIG